MTKDKIEFQPIDKIEEEPQPFIEEKKEESVDDDENDLDDGIFAKKAAANKRKKDEKGDAESVSKTETVATQSTAAAAAPAEEPLEVENKEESKDSAQVQLPLKRKRGRPKKTDVRVSEEVVQPVASAKRVRQSLEKAQSAATVPQQTSSYKHTVLATYDDVHCNFANAYRTGTDARSVDLSKVVRHE